MCRIILNLETAEKKRSKVRIWGRKYSAQLLNKEKEKRTLKQKQVERNSNEIRTYASIQ